MTTAPAAPALAAAVASLLAAYRARQPMRAGSLIVTVFGDALAPRGGAVLLADLMALLRQFGLNDSQVRTALSRLAGEGWLAAERRGRASLYRLSGTGRHRFAEAARRIYGARPTDWDGGVTLLVIPGDAAAGTRERLRRELGWLGFAALAPNVLAHPAPDRPALRSWLSDLSGADRPLVVEGKTEDGLPPWRGLIAAYWRLDALEARYRAFLASFAALDAALAGAAAPDPLDAMLARVLLVHDYRRIVLHDPMLPPALLPADWTGAAAYDLAARIYRRVQAPAEAWIDAHFHTFDGPLPAPAAEAAARFAAASG